MRRVLGPKQLSTLVLGLTLLGACGGDEPLASDQHEWDVVVVVLDALPAKRTGLYGAPEEGLTPHLDRLGTQGTLTSGGTPRPTAVLDAAFASASYTLASTASLFTGLWPPAHRVLGLDSNVLDPEHRTLAEVLAAQGFATAALSANPHISTEGGFDQGFGTFRHYFRDNFDNHTLPETFVPDAGAWWQHHAGERRFLYAHILPPHQPYTPPAPFAERFGADEVPRAEGLTPYLTELAQEAVLTADDPRVERILARYLASVSYADALLQELLTELAGPDGRGLERTIVVVTSDHGEAFGEHGQILHGTGVFEEFVRVPLVISLPASAPEELAGRFPHTATTADLAATLCELLDAPWPVTPASPTRPLNGASLVPHLTAGTAPGHPVLTRSAGDQPVWGLRTDERFLMRHGASDATLVFDVASDPGEQRPMDVPSQANGVPSQANGAPSQTSDLRARLDGLLERTRAAGKRFEAGSVPMLIHKDKLEQLGYFGD